MLIWIKDEARVRVNFVHGLSGSIRTVHANVENRPQKQSS
jgi:hypothetical protein